MNDLVTRVHALSMVLARKCPTVLATIGVLLESILEATGVDITRERLPTAPITLTAEEVLEAGRAYGVAPFGREAAERLVLLASLGLDLASPSIRAALVEMHHHREIRLVRLDNAGAARADLHSRGFRFELVDESVISDGYTTFHAVVLPEERRT